MGCYLEPKTSKGEWILAHGRELPCAPDDHYFDVLPASRVLVAYLAAPPAAFEIVAVMFSRRELGRWRGPRPDGDEIARPRRWFIVPKDLAESVCPGLDDWLYDGRMER